MTEVYFLEDWKEFKAFTLDFVDEKVAYRLQKKGIVKVILK